LSDERLRDLRRRWEASGQLEDEAAYLRERVRAGELTSDRLELAALCRHLGARAALGGAAPEPPPDDDWLHRSACAWGRSSKPVAVRMALIAAELVLPDFEATRPGEARPRRALKAAQAWLGAPSEEAAAEAAAAAAAAEGCFRGSPAGPEPLNRAYEAAEWAARAAAAPWVADAPYREIADDALTVAAWAVAFAAEWLQDEGRVRRHVTCGLAAWALHTEER
jgi:hypothetical protein